MTRRCKTMAGLTLVEVMVAMAVLSLVVLALGASLRGLSQSAQRVDERVEAIDEMRVAAAFLREVFDRATPVRRAGPDARMLFDAASGSLAWVSVMPARFGAAGRYVWRLTAEPQPDGSQALVLRHARWNPEATDFPDWDTAEARVLVARLQALAISYGGRGLGQGWQSDWHDAERLPQRLRLEVTTASGPWPPLVLPVRVPARPGAVFTIGGSTP